MTDIDPVTDLQALLDYSRDELLEQLDIDPAAVDDGYSYGDVTGLEMVQDPDAHPAYIYFDGDDVLVCYVEDENYLRGVTAAAVRRHLGEPAIDLRSPAGKTSTLSVYPDDGIAISHHADREPVDFLEVFHPTSKEAYQRDFYEDPGPFIK